MKSNLVNTGFYIIMKWSGWPLTVAAISVAISYILFHLGVYFFSFTTYISHSINKVFSKVGRAHTSYAQSVD